MTISIQSIRSILRTHWFFLVMAAVLISDALVVILDNWESPRILEAGLLFDFAILIPMMYLLCYRCQGKRAFIRSLALVSLGILAAGYVVPDANHYVLEKVGFLRYVGLAVLLMMEIKLGVAIYKTAFRKNDSNILEATKLIAESDMPEWLVKLITWEALMWHRVWNILLNLCRRK